MQGNRGQRPLCLTFDRQIEMLKCSNIGATGPYASSLILDCLANKGFSNGVAHIIGAVPLFKAISLK